MESYTYTPYSPPFPPSPSILRPHTQAYQLPKTPTSTNCIKHDISGATSDSLPKKMFILGMGYVGQYFAQQLKNEGWDISGTCTSITKKKELEQRGFDAYVFDACQPEWEILERLSCYSHLLVSIPPTEKSGDPVLEHENYIKARLTGGNLQWLGYLSSTSIYGDAEGAWVDEDYLPKPSSDLAKMRICAEEGWLKLGEDLGLSTYAFRLGGIYGPGRSAIDTILKRDQLSERQKRRTTRTFTSRVHVADICQALRASISIEVQRRIYNIVDDDPTSRAEVFEFAHQLIEKRWPGLINPDDLSLPQTLPKTGEKRVSNARMKKELGVRLLYPSYKSELQSIINDVVDPILHRI